MDLKTKLKSRKFWIGIVLLAIGVVLFFMGEKDAGVQLICLGGAGYLGMEGIADIVSRAKVIEESVENEVKVVEESEETTDIQ